MREDAFQRFLETKYKGPRSAKPLGNKSARDTVSRCRRIELALGIDLDTFLERHSLDTLFHSMIASAERFRFSGPRHHALYMHLSAARKYATFKSGKQLSLKKPYAWVKRNI